MSKFPKPAKATSLSGKRPRTCLVTDATFNEGGLLERIADNPEGLVDHYLTFDKNEDDALQSSEFTAAKIKTDGSFSDFDLNGDKAIDYGELFELASLVSYAQMEALYREYNEKYADSEGAGFLRLPKNRICL